MGVWRQQGLFGNLGFFKGNASAKGEVFDSGEAGKAILIHGRQESDPDDSGCGWLQPDRGIKDRGEKLVVDSPSVKGSTRPAPRSGGSRIARRQERPTSRGELNFPVSS